MTEPLDLRAVEQERYDWRNQGAPDREDAIVASRKASITCDHLIAALREARSALEEGKELSQRNLRKAAQRVELFRWGGRAAAVLTSVKDEP